MIEYAEALQDLLVPPGNRLEALRGDMSGFHSIRVNDQWRVVFQWRGGAAQFWMNAQASYELATHRIEVSVEPLVHAV